MPRLHVNIDHVATLRQARRASEPDPVLAAGICELAGANGTLARVRPIRGSGAPSRRETRWVNPDGTPLSETAGEPSRTTGAAAGEPMAIERASLPEDYRDHVRVFFGGE